MILNYRSNKCNSFIIQPNKDKLFQLQYSLFSEKRYRSGTGRARVKVLVVQIHPNNVLNIVYEKNSII